MGQELTDSCRECTSYARAKQGLGLGRAPIQHVSAYQPMTVTAVDIFGPLTTTDNGNHTDWDDQLQRTPNLLMLNRETTCPLDLMVGNPPPQWHMLNG